MTAPVAYQLTVTFPGLQLTADSTTPQDPTASVLLVDPLNGSWRTDVLPPVTTATQVTFVVRYRPTLGDPLPIILDQGTPCRLELVMDANTVLDAAGRISDVTAENVADGVDFTVIVTDWIGLLGSRNAPIRDDMELDVLASIVGGVYVGLGRLLDPTLTAVQVSNPTIDGPNVIPVFTDDYQGSPGLVKDWEWDNLSAYDVLTTAIMSDITSARDIVRYLAYKPLPAAPSDADVQTFELGCVDYPVDDITDVIGAYELVLNGRSVDLQVNDSYAGAGFVVGAGAVLKNASWSRQRASMVNEVVVAPSPGREAVGDDTTTVTVRVQPAYRDYGPISRQVQTILSNDEDLIDGYGVQAIMLADAGAEVPTGFSPDAVTLVYDLMTPAERDRVATYLWPTWETLVQGRPIVITDLAPQWQLAGTAYVLGRVVGATFALAGGRLFVQLLIRAVRPRMLAGGITFAELAALGGAGTIGGMTYTDQGSPDSYVNPEITFNDLQLVEG